MSQGRGATTRGRLATLWGAYDGTDVVVDLSEVLEEEGRVLVLRQRDGERLAVEASLVQLRRVVPARV